MKTMKLALPLMLALSGGCAHADVIPFLGGAQQFVVLGADAVTNTGASTLHGDLGIASGTAITGTNGITFVAGGAIHEGDGVAGQAWSDAGAAYDRLAALGGAAPGMSDVPRRREETAAR